MINSRKRRRVGSNYSTTAPTECDSTSNIPGSEEAALQAELFVAIRTAKNPSPRALDNLNGSSGLHDEQLFFVDTGNAARKSTPSHAITAQVASGTLWTDPVDEDLRIPLQGEPRMRKLRNSAQHTVVSGTDFSVQLKRQFEKTHAVPQWAVAARNEALRRRTPDDNEHNGSIHVFEPSAAGIQAAQNSPLRPGRLQISSMRDAGTRSDGAINALGFHPKCHILYSAGHNRRVEIFAIDGLANPLLQTVHIPEMSVQLASFHPNGDSICFAGRGPYIYIYHLGTGRVYQSFRGLWKSDSALQSATQLTGGITNLRHSPNGHFIALSGRQGYVHVLDTRIPSSGMVVGRLRHNVNSIAGISWSPDSSKITTVGTDAEVYEWDMRSQTCTTRWRDQGGFGTVELESNCDGTLLAVGSSTGVVNIYENGRSCASSISKSVGMSIERKPLKTLYNLTNSVSTMRFNHTSNLLALASAKKRDQIKLIHIPTFTVFQNWPDPSTAFGRVTAVDFSHTSEYFAVSNAQGRILLYSLGHFGKQS